MYVFFFLNFDKFLKYKFFFKFMYVNVEFKFLVIKIFFKLINNCFVVFLKLNELIWKWIFYMVVDLFVVVFYGDGLFIFFILRILEFV